MVQAQRWMLLLIPEKNIQFEVFSAEIFKIMVYCAEVLVRHCYVLHGHHNWQFGFDHCLWNASWSHGKLGKTMNYMKPSRFSEFLIQLCIEKRFSFGLSRNITTVCRKIAFFGVRAEILLSRNQGGLDSRAGPFLGYVQIYSFLEKYSPLSITSKNFWNCL